MIHAAGFKREHPLMLEIRLPQGKDLREDFRTMPGEIRTPEDRSIRREFRVKRRRQSSAGYKAELTNEVCRI
jgi:hypothetical protein